LYEMSTGALPFRGESSGVVFKAILDATPTSAARLNPAVPTELERIISKCLEKECSLRYQHASDIRTDMLRLKRNEESKGIAGEIHLPQVDRKRNLWIGATALLALLALFAWGAYRHFVPKHLPFAHLEFTQLTTSGKAATAAMSPDGRYMAYAVDEVGEFWGGETKESLWVRQVVGGEVQVVPPSEVRYVWITFSRDGDFLYAVRSEGKDTGSRSLYKVSALGGIAKRLIADVDSKVTLSPDGKRFVFVRHSPEKNQSALVIVS